MPDSATIELLFFYMLAFVALIGALGVVFEKRLLRSVMCLVLTLGCSAGLTILLDFSFNAAIQVLVFIGGIVILLIYAVMMTSDGQTFQRKPEVGNSLRAGVSCLIFFGVTCWVILNSSFTTKSVPEPTKGEAAQIGRLLLSNEAGGYILAFEIISLLLLAALIGGIVVARRMSSSSQAALGKEGTSC